MIPRSNITAWRNNAPWPTNEQVEQDLAISRVLIDLFNSKSFSENLVFRGGTALHKLYFEKPGRYSEDIDLVQRKEGPIGTLIDQIHEILDPWLGKPKWNQNQGRFTISYRFLTTYAPSIRMTLKIEINTREHFSVLEIKDRTFVVSNPWFAGSAQIPVYQLEELLGTKLRALYQRNKGRDLFDLWMGLNQGNADPAQIIACFSRYLENENLRITRQEFEDNLALKVKHERFLSDIRPLIRTDSRYDVNIALEMVMDSLICALK